MNNNKYEQPLISKHFNFPKDTALRQNNAVQQTHSTNTTKTDNVNEPQNDADAAAKMKIAPQAEKIDALLMLKLFLDRNSGEDFLRIEPNKCMFWYNCDIPDALDTIGKMPYNSFWRREKHKVQKCFAEKQKCKNTNRNEEKFIEVNLEGEKSSIIVAESLGIKTIRMLMDSVDGGNVRGVWKLASGIFASHAEGTVFLLMNNSVASKSGGRTWKTIERPQLMKNKNIDMIVELDFYNPNKVNSITFPNGMKDTLKNYTFKVPVSILNENIAENSFISINELFDNRYKDLAKKAFSKPFKLEYTGNGIAYKLVNPETGDIENSNEITDIEELPKLVKNALYTVYSKFANNNHVLKEVSQLLKSNMYTNYEGYWNGLLAKIPKTNYNNKVMPSRQPIKFRKFEVENTKVDFCKKSSMTKNNTEKLPTLRETKVR